MQLPPYTPLSFKPITIGGVSSFPNPGATYRTVSQSPYVIQESQSSSPPRDFFSGVYGLLQEGLRQAPRLVQAFKGQGASPESIQIVVPSTEEGIFAANRLKLQSQQIPRTAFPKVTDSYYPFTAAEVNKPSLVPGISDMTLAILGAGIAIMVMMVSR